MDNNIDLDNATTVEKSYTRKQDFDLRYSVNQEKFQVSDEFYQENAMNKNGFTLKLLDDQLLLAVQSNEDSVFFKGKPKEEGQKNSSFANSILEKKLNQAEMLPTDVDMVHYDLVHVGEDSEGVPHFRIDFKNTRTIESTQTEVTDDGTEKEDVDTIPEEEELDTAPEGEDNQGDGSFMDIN